MTFQSLTVRVIEAKGLISKDDNGLSDPFVELTYGSITVQTKIQFETLNPRWDAVRAAAHAFCPLRICMHALDGLLTGLVKSTSPCMHMAARERIHAPHDLPRRPPPPPAWLPWLPAGTDAKHASPKIARMTVPYTTACAIAHLTRRATIQSPPPPCCVAFGTGSHLRAAR